MKRNKAEKDVEQGMNWREKNGTIRYTIYKITVRYASHTAKCQKTYHILKLFRPAIVWWGLNNEDEKQSKNGKCQESGTSRG